MEGVPVSLVYVRPCFQSDKHEICTKMTSLGCDIQDVATAGGFHIQPVSESLGQRGNRKMTQAHPKV